ncbi:hypothetical protein GLE_0672 [Lysobacter enzymogenes]|uniref:Uncharacterized protein n=1 Tax=Lysobacter enzymogenes TaxID=69 RepID=A0A0S2DBX6_LYSEN|nr:hypothetical protein GLE_0672 [Lysobacter enzymogenes]
MSDAHGRNMNDVRACFGARRARTRKRVDAMARMRARRLNGTETKRFVFAGSSPRMRSRGAENRCMRNPPRARSAPPAARPHPAPCASRHDRHGQPP